MISRDPEALATVVVEASQLAGARLILSPGWGRVVPRAALPADVFLLEECPHSWLFPRVQAAIHHGGAGTTATTLHYGIPSTVVAFFADQPAWGRTLERLGVSPATHRMKSLNAEALASSIRALAIEPRFRKRAQELQESLAGEDRGGLHCRCDRGDARRKHAVIHNDRKAHLQRSRLCRSRWSNRWSRYHGETRLGSRTPRLTAGA